MQRVVPSNMAKTMIQDRCKGLLYGQVIGDALGARYEFKKAHEVQLALDNDTKNGKLEILGGGPWHMRPGQVTDDSEMALGMARTLIANNRYDQAKTAVTYCKWAKSNPPDMGINTKKALWGPSPFDCDALSPEGVRDKVLKSVKDRCGASKSNGSLMRLSPLILPFVQSNNRDGLLAAVEQDTALTHCNEVVCDANRVYAIALHTLCRTGDATESYNEALANARTPGVVDTLKAAQNAMEHKDSDHIGYVLVALQTAFHSLLHADTFERGLVKVISIGGDTDTNGCIAGAMLGAKFGANAVPEIWKKRVRESKTRRGYDSSWCGDIESVTDKLFNLNL